MIIIFADLNVLRIRSNNICVVHIHSFNNQFKPNWPSNKQCTHAFNRRKKNNVYNILKTRPTNTFKRSILCFVSHVIIITKTTYSAQIHQQC